MNKSERLNDMMLYLNDKSYFNLKDLMMRYRISKSTALRDITSLEQIGMPIYSELGRNGRYGILQNKLLSPILFQIDEVYALYFAMLSLQAYQTTPFHLDLLNLKKKFESCLSEEHISKLNHMGRMFSFEGSGHPNISPLLKEILISSLNGRVAEISYRKNDRIQYFHVQFFRISSSFGQWYATGYDHQSRKVRVFRCDKLLSLEESTDYAPLIPDDAIMDHGVLYRGNDAVDFKVSLTAKGVDRFYKEHYPSMELEYEENIPIIKGFYHPGEETFIADYFIAYGTEVCSLEPAELKLLIVKRCEAVRNYYELL